MRKKSSAMPATAVTRGIGPLLFLFGLLGAGVVLTKYWQLGVEPPPAAHRSDKGIRLDPWRPLPGCITLRGDDGQARPWLADAASRVACQSRPGIRMDDAVSSMKADESGFAALLRATAPLRVPLRTDPALPMTQIEHQGRSVPAGATLRLTLKAAPQARADNLLACLSGHQDACPAAGIPADSWQHHFENAALRAGTLLVMDIATGSIETLASGYSPCYIAEESGQPLPVGCPPSAREPGARPWKLANGALFADEMPGSLVKLAIILGLLRDTDLGPALLRSGAAQDRLLDDIRRSDTANFLDRVFCRDRGFNDCNRLGGLRQAAADLGWNRPQGNLLALEAMPRPMNLQAPAARFMRRPAKAANTWQDLPLDYQAERARRCAEQGKDLRWSKCRDEAVANVVAELWGQGNARISPLAVAATLGRIAGAANGQARIGVPHLLQAVEGDRQTIRSDPRAELDTSNIAQAHAALILKGLSLTHQPGGTAYSACLHALGHGPQAVQACGRLKGVAGKTGTPVFNHDRLTVTARAAHCAGLRAHVPGKGVALQSARRAVLAQCQVAPLKWYAAVVREDPAQASGPFTKVIVALAERNWRRDGRIDSSQDRGPNIAAEMVFRYLFKTGGDAHDRQ